MYYQSFATAYETVPNVPATRTRSQTGASGLISYPLRANGNSRAAMIKKYSPSVGSLLRKPFAIMYPTKAISGATTRLMVSRDGDRLYSLKRTKCSMRNITLIKTKGFIYTMPCENCKRKGIPMPCNFCSGSYCSRCINLTAHKCEGLQQKMDKDRQVLNDSLKTIVSSKVEKI